MQNFYENNVKKKEKKTRQRKSKKKYIQWKKAKKENKVSFVEIRTIQNVCVSVCVYVYIYEKYISIIFPSKIVFAT